MIKLNRKYHMDVRLYECQKRLMIHRLIKLREKRNTRRGSMMFCMI